MIREKIRDQVFVGPRENSGSSVISMRSLLDRRGVRSGLHFRRIPSNDWRHRWNREKDSDKETAAVGRLRAVGSDGNDGMWSDANIL